MSSHRSVCGANSFELTQAFSSLLQMHLYTATRRNMYWGLQNSLLNMASLRRYYRFTVMENLAGSRWKRSNRKMLHRTTATVFKSAASATTCCLPGPSINPSFTQPDKANRYAWCFISSQWYSDIPLLHYVSWLLTSRYLRYWSTFLGNSCQASRSLSKLDANGCGLSFIFVDAAECSARIDSTYVTTTNGDLFHWSLSLPNDIFGTTTSEEARRSLAVMHTHQRFYTRVLATDFIIKASSSLLLPQKL